MGGRDGSESRALERSRSTGYLRRGLVTTLDTRNSDGVVGRVTPARAPTRALCSLARTRDRARDVAPLVSELIALAGGDSVTADSADGYPRYSLEAAVARAPQVIILADRGAGARHPGAGRSGGTCALSLPSRPSASSRWTAI